jgi:hypothetical protein
MGGQTNLRRPQFLAEQLANTAILPTMLAISVTGANPTWDQPKSANDDVSLDKARTCCRRLRLRMARGEVLWC